MGYKFNSVIHEEFRGDSTSSGENLACSPAGVEEERRERYGKSPKRITSQPPISEFEYATIGPSKYQVQDDLQTMITHPVELDPMMLPEPPMCQLSDDESPAVQNGRITRPAVHTAPLCKLTVQ
jgi:hypothetical protein